MRKNPVNPLGKWLLQNFSIIKIYESKMVLLSQHLLFCPQQAAGTIPAMCRGDDVTWVPWYREYLKDLLCYAEIQRFCPYELLWLCCLHPSIALWRFCSNFTREGATTTDIAKHILYLEWKWKSFFHRNKIVHDNCI